LSVGWSFWRSVMVTRLEGLSLGHSRDQSW
jgi:hypothetical protein